MQVEKVREFRKFAKEVVLKVLMKMDSDYKNYEKLEDYDGMQKIKLELIPKYEKLYSEFSNDISENIDDLDDEKVENLMSIINDIMKINNINIDFILDEIEKRERLKGKSGAETVEKLFKFQISELERTKEKLLERANLILDKEEKLEVQLRDAIQDEEQMKILDKLIIIRSEWGKEEKKIMRCQSNLDNLKETIGKKWTYDIYGTIPQGQLKEVFNSQMGKENNN